MQSKFSKKTSKILTYGLILQRQDEKQQNKKCQYGAIGGLIFFIISKIAYPIIFLNPYFLIPSFISKYVPWVLTMLFGICECICYFKSSREVMYSLNTLVEDNIVTNKEIDYYLSLGKDNIKDLILEEKNQRKHNSNEVERLERAIRQLEEYNDNLVKTFELEEKVLNDKLLKEEFEGEFETFLNERKKPEKVHYSGEYEKPYKLVFTNK